ncbi:MAG TPA: hypothetical protein VNN99_06990 [Vicinamibacterales bacterium]|nr:hypothetical protein [Vicinamibacterales bacterium]
MRVRSVLRGVLVVLVLGAAGLGGFVWWNLHDRSPGSEFSVVVRPTPSVPANLRVGFGRRTINPDMARPVWVAGFAHNRAATRIHDDLKAVAAVIDDGEHRIGLVALDAIGFFHDEVLAVRRSLPSSARLDYVVVASTHNHSAPDLMGIWGPSDFRSGIDPAYRQAVVAGAAAALTDAVEALTPAAVSFLEVPLDPAGLVADSRDPQVFDATLRLMHFTAPNGSTIGTIVNWADHPETPWADNTELTADFPGYLRDALETGVTVDGRAAETGLGGVHLYVNGAIGGLMTTNPQTTVLDPYTQQPFTAPSHDKARALGRRLAQAALAAVRAGGTPVETEPRIGFAARTLELPIDNTLFRLANALGLFGRGQPRLNHIRSEVAVLTFGDASLTCVPGELYPEIANGGVERSPGADFDLAPIEVPPLRDLMPGRVKFLVGLANDEVGYIIPKSEWDAAAPWLYGAPERHYGEINSLGPETAPLIHQALKDLWASFAASARLSASSSGVRRANGGAAEAAYNIAAGR